MEWNHRLELGSSTNPSPFWLSFLGVSSLTENGQAIVAKLLAFFSEVGILQIFCWA